MRRAIILVIIQLIVLGGNVNAQKKGLKGASAVQDVSVKVPYRITIEKLVSNPQEIVLGVGTVTIFHLPEPALKVLFGNKEGIDVAEPNETSERSDIYIRSTIPRIRTNMVLEFQSGVLILNVRTVDKKGGVLPGDYHGEVFIKLQAINKATNADNKVSNQPKDTGGGAGQKEETPIKNDSIDRQIIELQSTLKLSQSELSKTKAELNDVRAKNTTVNQVDPKQFDDHHQLNKKLDMLEKSVREKDGAIRDSGNTITKLEKRIHELEHSIKSGKSNARQSITESAKLKKEVSRLEEEISKGSKDLSSANLKIIKLESELYSKSLNDKPEVTQSVVSTNSNHIDSNVTADMDITADIPNKFLTSTLTVLEELVRNRITINKSIGSGGVYCNQIGSVIKDEFGQYWIGIYLRNARTQDLSLLTINDPDNKDYKFFLPTRFNGRSSTLLKQGEESSFFVTVNPGHKSTKPRVLELIFSKHKIKLNLD